MVKPKYRILSRDELLQFEQEFINFLVVNGIVADDWVKLKKSDPLKAEEIVILFSDVIFEKIMRTANFLEFVSNKYIQGVQCLSDKMIMVAINSKAGAADLPLEGLDALDFSDVEFHKGEKKYQLSREQEIFALIQKGYVISEGELFKALLLASV